ncbi:hypothetical protein Q75_12545 [Bacillus coahuilensis p1.1.43]|uniref:Yip1 domain-containing protein n=1 Tax=Bacillus coahuilensis p1.1.43 TaxID=1150625 RepID=A0A147K679_9BACI|nr:DUF5366 family protein [Bacillus coahuilensis]KUP05346.1 hypothetical protein Q75_12545 [Bacillus coahuilensis p1.1.43]
MRNAFVTSYVPLLSILLFSLSYSIYVIGKVKEFLRGIGLYQGMSQFLSEVQLTVLLIASSMTFFFMLLSAFKLIAETINGLSFLFFVDSRDELNLYTSLKPLSWIFLVGGFLSIFLTFSIWGMVGISVLVVLIYLVVFFYNVGAVTNIGRLLGVMLFNISSYSALILLLLYIGLKLYNGVLSSLSLVPS